MAKSRRSFLKNTMAVLAGTLVSGPHLEDERPKNMGDAVDTFETLMPQKMDLEFVNPDIQSIADYCKAQNTGYYPSFSTGRVQEGDFAYEATLDRETGALEVMVYHSDAFLDQSINEAIKANPLMSAAGIDTNYAPLFTFTHYGKTSSFGDGDTVLIGSDAEWKVRFTNNRSEAEIEEVGGKRGLFTFDQVDNLTSRMYVNSLNRTRQPFDEAIEALYAKLPDTYKKHCRQ